MITEINYLEKILRLHPFLENTTVSSEKFELRQKTFQLFLSGEEPGVCYFQFMMKEKRDLLGSI